jgi:hypothetical protein
VSTVSTAGGTTTGRRTLAIVLAVIGIIALIVGIIYFVDGANALPSFLPGHIAHKTFHHDKRATAGVVVGVLLLVAAWWTGKKKK